MLGRQVTFLLRRPPLPLRLATSSTQCLSARSLHTTPAALGVTASKPGRPKKAVGEPSRVIKRAVKRVAKKPASDPDDAASQQVAAKQAGTTPKTKAKAKAAKPKALKKAKKATPPKKVYTEAQLAAKKERAARAKAAKDVKSLKAAALSPPKIVPSNAYLQFIKAHKGDLQSLVNAEKEKLPEGSKLNIKGTLTEHSKNLSAAWKEQSPADIEHFNHLAHTTTEAHQAAYKSWVQSHTPDEVKLANSARRSLRRRESSSSSGSEPAKNRRTRWPAILDEREPKAAVQPYIQFSIARNASGDFKHLPLIERSKLIGEEWKALEVGEKKKYETLHSADRERYIDEYSSVHGHAPLAQLESQHPELTSAASAA
ncbi:hypothetical protein LTR95_000207 [Oleoguttula sp. CCFEE 5521]